MLAVSLMQLMVLLVVYVAQSLTSSDSPAEVLAVVGVVPSLVQVTMGVPALRGLLQTRTIHRPESFVAGTAVLLVLTVVFLLAVVVQ